MSRDGQNLDQTTIDTLLKSLTSRPNVQSTLILSRKDGSIIRATGFPHSGSTNNVPSLIQDKVQLNSSSTGTTSNEAMIKGQSEYEIQKESISPVQRLAGTIYEYVMASSILATSLAQSRKSEQVTTTEPAAHPATQSQNSQPNLEQDDDVQLLRLRTKRQEVIVFPDPNYLCCVIQNIARAADRNEPT